MNGHTRIVSSSLSTNLLTVDVEDYFHVTSFEDMIPREAWDRMECRIEATTGRTLEILASYSVRATFFMLGWVAERYPGLVSEIAGQGHEIASHGYDHRMVSQLTPGEFREDVRKSKLVLEELTGKPVTGYRAPTFSVSSRTPWALPILAEEGYVYDSSTFPVRHDRYGDPTAKRFIHRLRLGEGIPDLVEVPLTTLRVLGLNVPAAGGGYLRLFPLAVIRAAIRDSNRRGFPAVVYFHPWELDPEQPRVRARLLSRFRHYVNLGRTEAKLCALLAWTDFCPMGEFVGRWGARGSDRRSQAEAGNGPRGVESALAAAPAKRRA